MSTSKRTLQLFLYIALCLTCAVVAASCSAQAVGDYLFQRKAISGFTPEWDTPSNGGLLYYNGTGGILNTPSTAYGRGALNIANAAAFRTYIGAGSGTGTVTNFSFTNANGISGSVLNATTTPALTLSLGAITPTSVNGITLSGSGSLANSCTSSLTGFTGSGTSSGTNTGDQSLTAYVQGPASAVDDNIALFDGITGKLIQDAGINLSEVVEEDPGPGVGMIESGAGVSPIVLKNIKDGLGTQVVNNTGSVQVDIDFTAADRYYYSDGSALPVEGVITTAGRNLLDDATTSDQRTTLGLGTAAVANTGTGASDVPTITDADARYLTPFQPTLLSVAGPLSTTSTSLANVTGAVFNSVPTGMLRVQFMIDYDAAATTVGAYFAIDGTATQTYLGVNVLYNTSQGDNPSRSSIAFNSWGTSSSSRATTSNVATVNVYINVTVSGTIQLRYATEAAGNAITIQSVTGFIMKAG